MYFSMTKKNRIEKKYELFELNEGKKYFVQCTSAFFYSISCFFISSFFSRKFINHSWLRYQHVNEFFLQFYYGKAYEQESISYAIGLFK